MAWSPDPHLPIEKLAPNLWRVQANMSNPPLSRVMTMVRLADGRGLVHSAVMMDDASMRELDAWAKPAIMIVPNAFHRKDARAFKDRYPSLLTVCPSVARDKVADKVPVDATYESFDTGDPSVRVVPIDGVGGQEAALSVRSSDGVTLVFNDLVFNMPHAHGPRGWVLRHVFASSGGPRISRLGRAWLVKDKAKVRAELERLADTPELVRVIVSHHEMIGERPREALRQVAASL